MSILSTLIVIFHHVHHISYNQLHVSFIATISRPSADVISKCSVIRGHVPISKAHQTWHVFISSISNSNQCMITTCRYDLKVWVIRCEDRANITGLCKLVQGFQICFWIHLKTSKYTFGWTLSHLSCLGELFKLQVWKVAEDNLLLEVVPDRLKLVSVGSAKRNFVSDQASLPQVEMDKSNHPKGLVTLRPLSPGPAGDILPGAKDDRVHGCFNLGYRQ